MDRTEVEAVAEALNEAWEQPSSTTRWETMAEAAIAALDAACASQGEDHEPCSMVYLVWRIEGDGMLELWGKSLLDVFTTREAAEAFAKADTYGPCHIEERVLR